MSIEVMKMAIEALESDNPDIQLRAAIALRQAIEQAERASKRTISYACPVCCASMIEQAEQVQPAAWYDPEVMNEDRGISWTHGQFHTAPLYTAPPQRKPLTDKEISAVFGKNGINPIVFARAIEAAHGIKEKT